MIYFLPPTIAGADRVFHPGPWLGFLTAVITLLTQPSLSKETLLSDASDARSAMLILAGVALTQLAATLDFSLRPGLFPPPLSAWVVIGSLVIGTGLVLRVWAIRTLGRFFTSSVTVQADQTVLSGGPYRLIRHPSYSGMLLSLLGVSCALGTLIGITLVLIVNVPTYLYRIRVEERVLDAGLGEEYVRYRAGTWRLVPFVL